MTRRRRRRDLPRPGQANTVGAWTVLLSVLEGLAVLGERDQAAKFYPLVLEAIDSSAITGWFGYGLLQTVAVWSGG